MTNCLLIMHPRVIPEVVDSINAIDVPKAWFRGYDSLSIGPALNRFVEDTNYDYYTVTSDDVILYNDAAKIIFGWQYSAVTGYCNMFVGSEYVGLCSKPLTLLDGVAPTEADYELMKQDEVNAMPDDIFETYFMGFSLTRLSRAMWLRFPFQKYIIRSGRKRDGDWKGVSSDHNISMRLTRAGVSMYTHKEAFCYHLKPAQPNSRHGKTLRDGWIVGKEPPSVRWEK